MTNKRSNIKANNQEHAQHKLKEYHIFAIRDHDSK
jgi:hypothetical protein